MDGEESQETSPSVGDSWKEWSRCRARGEGEVEESDLFLHSFLRIQFQVKQTSESFKAVEEIPVAVSIVFMNGFDL